MHSLTCMSVVVCVVRKPRPCNSYSRRRDRIDSVFWRSYYKGGGGTDIWADLGLREKPNTYNTDSNDWGGSRLSSDEEQLSSDEEQLYEFSLGKTRKTG